MGGCSGKFKKPEQDLGDQPEPAVETEQAQVAPDSSSDDEVVSKEVPLVDDPSDVKGEDDDDQAEKKETTVIASDDQAEKKETTVAASDYQIQQDKFETPTN